MSLLSWTCSWVISPATTHPRLINPRFAMRPLQSSLLHVGFLHQLLTWALPYRLQPLYLVQCPMSTRSVIVTPTSSQLTSIFPQPLLLPSPFPLPLHRHEIKVSTNPWRHRPRRPQPPTSSPAPTWMSYPTSTMLLNSIAPTISPRSHAIAYQTRNSRMSWQLWQIHSIPAR